MHTLIKESLAWETVIKFTIFLKSFSEFKVCMNTFDTFLLDFLTYFFKNFHCFLDDESKLLLLDFDDLFKNLLRSQNHTRALLLKILPRLLA